MPIGPFPYRVDYSNRYVARSANDNQLDCNIGDMETSSEVDKQGYYMNVYDEVSKASLAYPA